MAAGQRTNGRGAVPSSGKQALGRIYTIKTADAGANVYYRLEVPSRVARDQGRATLVLEDLSPFGVRLDAETQLKNMVEADYHLYYGGPNKTMQERISFLLGIQPGHSTAYNYIRSRPGIFWSLDDDFHQVNPLNQAYLWNGYKTPDGKILGRGDSCGIKLPDGQEVILWEYGKQYYDSEVFLPERNRKNIRQMDEMLAKVDGVYFTTQRLADAYAPFVKNRFVFPNCIYFPDWKFLPNQHSVRDDPEEIRVLWQGGASHFADLMSVQESMRRLSAKYPKLRWIMWGADFPAVHRVIPDDQFGSIPWVSYSAYRPVLEGLDFDFAIAPLVRSTFNNGKSSIKAYEPAALQHPKPTLAANVPPYADDLVDGETALLYDQGDAAGFEDRFSALVEDGALRNQIAARCQAWLREERNAETWTPKLLRWLRESRGSGVALAPELGEMMNDLVRRGSFTGDMRRARDLAGRL